MKDEILYEGILNFKIVCNPVSEIVRYSLASNKITIVNTLNAHSYIVQKTNNKFKEALKGSNYLIPDGSGIVLASKILKNKSIKKVSGYDFFLETMNQLDKTGKSVFFLGSSSLVLDKIKERIKIEYPNITHAYLSPPFKDKFSDNDCKNFIYEINKFEPDVVFVGLTAPKQEILINQIHKEINVSFISGIGAVFDFYGMTIKRPNKLFIFMHLEWLGRFIQNPRKMFNRVFISMPIFIIDIFKERFKTR